MLSFLFWFIHFKSCSNIIIDKVFDLSAINALSSYTNIHFVNPKRQPKIVNSLDRQALRNFFRRH